MDSARVNLPAWNERAAIHLRDSTGFYDIAGFRAGADSLTTIEAAEIGDVAGLRVAHLQCHIGLDTLSLARRGAEAFGLDFSPVAIAGARGLAGETGIAATFVEADVYDAREVLPGAFDLVYVTWGAINWLPDIRRWAAVVGSLLKPGGRLYLAETHPCAFALEEENGRHVVTYPWRSAPEAPLVFEATTTYTADPTPLANTRHQEWLHPLSAILGGLAEAGMTLAFLHEHETLPYRLFPSMIEAGRQVYRLPDGAVRLPLSFSLSAVKRS
jgi:SAM-dependent methyltransferase